MFRKTAAAMVSLLLLTVRAEAAQEKQELPPPSGPSLKVSIEIVNVYAVVRGNKGRLIPNLARTDFEVTEDNVAQQISYFSSEANTPLTLGILVDTSPSQARVLDIEKEEAKKFLSQVLRAKDLAFVLHFDVEVELLQDLTNNARLLARAIDDMAIGGGGRGVLPAPLPTGNVGGTHLYDAAYLASNELLRNETGRKVLVVLSDGEDQGSQVKLAEALESAQKADVIVYSIAIIDRGFYFGRLGHFQGGDVLKKLAQETGGRMIEVNRTKDTAPAFQAIAEELRTQYLLGYTPANTRHDGAYRKIRVRVRSGEYKVQARRGYYAPAE